MKVIDSEIGAESSLNIIAPLSLTFLQPSKGVLFFVFIMAYSKGSCQFKNPLFLCFKMR
jgi:hypothetical protein